jgi:hypothetical protein
LREADLQETVGRRLLQKCQAHDVTVEASLRSQRLHVPLLLGQTTPQLLQATVAYNFVKLKTMAVAKAATQPHKPQVRGHLNFAIASHRCYKVLRPWLHSGKWHMDRRTRCTDLA